MYRTLSLFAGIGGFDLGLERAGGFRTVAFCEIDPFCRRVLAKHWPSVPCYEDVRELTAERLASDGIEVDCIVGGFPCQDLSFAGKGAGLAGERSGLWSEYARLVGELRPAYVIVENVAALLSRGLGTVLGDLAALGFDAEWHCIPASAVGAPHRRDRLWIVAYPAWLQQGRAQQRPQRQRTRAGREPEHGSNAEAAKWRWTAKEDDKGWRHSQAGRLGFRLDWAEHWFTEPDVGRVAYGVPERVHRLRALGNAVVPQIPEMIGRAILEADQMRKAA